MWGHCSHILFSVDLVPAVLGPVLIFLDPSGGAVAAETSNFVSRGLSACSFVSLTQWVNIRATGRQRHLVLMNSIGSKCSFMSFAVSNLVYCPYAETTRKLYIIFWHFEKCAYSSQDLNKISTTFMSVGWIWSSFQIHLTHLMSTWGVWIIYTHVTPVPWCYIVLFESARCSSTTGGVLGSFKINGAITYSYK